jgi:pyridoxal phosphate enzyme (YggS family)
LAALYLTNFHAKEPMDIAGTLLKINQELSGSDCQLVAVSKTKSAELIMEAYDAGQRVFGENKVQELSKKHETLPKDIKWHMIGHLQSNKVKYIAPFVNLIHAVDSEKLLGTINKEAKKNERIIDCLLQIHIATEETKFGMNETEIRSLLTKESFSDYQNINIIGLMGMATNTPDESKVASEFNGLKVLQEELKSECKSENINLHELSIGMSGDYKIALKQGSTMIRIGSSIFGARNYP